MTPRDNENTSQFFQRCVADLRRTPLEVALPEHLTDEHERLTKRYQSLKKADFRFLFDKLSCSRAALILPLFKQVVRTVRSAVRQ